MSQEDISRYADSIRLVLYHKQATSARTRYLRLADGVCAFQPLPEGAVASFEACDSEADVLPHPGAVIAAAERWLNLPDGGLEFQGEFRARVQAGDKAMRVYLVRFTTIDPPFEAAEHVGAKFIAITEARGLPQVELELLRRAYECVMEG